MASSYAGYLQIVNELIELEEQNLTNGLSSDSRSRWRALTQMLFGPPTSEKRRFFRVAAARPAKVVAPEMDAGAEVVSLSGGGLFLKTNIVPEVGSEMKVMVPFPPEDVMELCFRAEVRWTSDDRNEDGPGPGVGLSFTGLDRDQRRAILKLLKEHLIKNLEMTLEKYNFFFRLSPELTLLVDHQNRVIECNEQARHLLSRGDDGEAQVEGTDFFDLVSIETQPALLGAIATTRRLGEAARCEIDIPRGDQSVVPIEAMISAVRTNELDLGILIAGRDMTERKQIEAQRRDLERRLYQADKLASLGQIAAGIAHDINNPLAWVQSNLALLERYAGPLSHLVDEALQNTPNEQTFRLIQKNLHGAIDDSVEGVRRIASIIGDLKMFSRVEALQESHVDVNEALETSLRMVRNQIEQRAHVVREYGDIPRTSANFGKISQVFLNLITNASRSFEHPDVTKNIVTLRTWVVEDAIKVSIGDNGRGIPHDVQDRIFEPFFTMGAAEEGTGLGLTIARDAVKAIGGEIELESDLGKGTRFIVSIPLRTATPETRRAPSDPSPADVATRPRLLVVDDEEILLRTFRRQLSSRWDVDTARTGPDALARIAETSYDAILCDVMIPGMSGTSIYLELTARYPTIVERIVFMTGGTFGQREKEVLENLPNLVIEKPFDMKTLEKMLLEIAGIEKPKSGPHDATL